MFFIFYFAFFIFNCHFSLLTIFAKAHREISEAHKITFVGYDDMKYNRLGFGA